jgi:lipoprotein-anchoring transpeptidase ErfK/SrfK
MILRRVAGALLLAILGIATYRAVVPPKGATVEFGDFTPGPDSGWSVSTTPADPEAALLDELTRPSARPCTIDTLIAKVAGARVTARAAPRPTARPIGTFDRTNAYGARQVFTIERSVRGTDGTTWFEALLPLRPNGTTGFVPSASVDVVRTPYRLVVDRSAFTLEVWNGCTLKKRYTIGIGTGSTPTPAGRFYLIALLKPPGRGSIYGDYAYGLSAFSDRLTDWEGGGVIGLHGTNDPSSIGKRSSHGCIRMRNRDIARLVKILPLGTPIVVL